MSRYQLLLATLIAMANLQLSAASQTLPMADTDRPGWWGGEGLAGDAFGARSALGERGIHLFGSYTFDIFGNTLGGLKTGTVYSGLLDFGLEMDLEKAIGWTGASFSTTWLWLSGRDASEDLVGNFLTISNIAGFNTLRMLELWLQQNAFDDILSLRLGELAADSEFLISDYAALFLNGTFGWPAVAYMNLPEGGPGYPMGTLGVRLAFTPTPWLTLLSAAFQGNVFAQDINRHGFRYRLNAATGYSFLNEIQCRWNHAEDASGLPGKFKSGFWLQSGRFANPLADATASGNAGFYFILDQMLFRKASSKVEEFSPAHGLSKSGDGKAFKNQVPPAATSDQGLGAFSRIAFTPQDRNFVSFYLDAGFSYKGPIPRRDEDTLGLAFGYAQVSSGARSSLREEGFKPAGAEMVLEATYQIQINPWFSLQPDLQFIIQPGATRSLGNSLLLGFRGSITF